MAVVANSTCPATVVLSWQAVHVDLIACLKVQVTSYGVNTNGVAPVWKAWRTEALSKVATPKK